MKTLLISLAMISIAVAIRLMIWVLFTRKGSDELFRVIDDA